MHIPAFINLIHLTHLPYLPVTPRYLAFVALADVVFEPFPFRSGVSSFEIFSVGIPVVIFPTAAPWIMQVRPTGEVGRAGGAQDGCGRV